MKPVKQSFLNAKMKVIHVVYTLEMGGLEHLVFTLLKSLNFNKYSLEVCCLSRGGIFNEKIQCLGIPVFIFEKKKGIDYSLFFRLARFFCSRKDSIVHTHNTATWLYGGIAARIAGVKVCIHTEHSNLFEHQKGLLWVEKLLSLLTNVVIADSNKVNAHLVECQGIRRDKVSTIYNGIDVEKFQWASEAANIKNVLGISLGDRVVGMVARLEKVKNHACLLRAFRQVLNTIPNVSLVFVGDGSESSNLKQYARDLNILEKVYFLGTRTDIPEILNILDIFVLSSKSEGLSLSLLEAMAAGKPIVATNVGGNPEIVDSGVTGLLVPDNDHQKMAEGIIGLLRNKELAQAMGIVGRRRVQERFSLDRMVDEYEKLYDTLLENS